MIKQNLSNHFTEKMVSHNNYSKAQSFYKAHHVHHFKIGSVMLVKV